MKKVWVVIIALFFTTSPLLSQEQVWFDESQSIEIRVEALVDAMTLDEKIAQLLNYSPAIERLGVPEYDWWNEALHGVARNGKATIFPQGIALGATFDPELVQNVADAISTEARAKYSIAQQVGNRGKYAGLTFWTPNVNVFRDPRWGRGQESYSEDPYHLSKMGVAFVKGLQGDDTKYLKTAACAKHFAVHSGPEEERHHFNVSPSAKDFHETYLPAFEALVVDAKVEGVMGAYNAVYDDPSCSSSFLLDSILRKTWSFDGYVVSDCGAIGDIFSGHEKAESAEQAAAMALASGVNLNCGWAYQHLNKAIEQGLVDENVLDERLTQLLKTRFRLGMFDKETPFSTIPADKIHCQEHVQLSREAATKSMVLLKNDNNVLPLKKDIRVPYVTGPFANSNDVLMGSYYGISSGMVTVLEGIADKVSLGSSLNYRSGALPFQENLNPKNWAPFVAGESDVTICVVGISADMEGEEVDAIASNNKGDRKDLRLPENQIFYIKELAKHKKGPLVLVLASGSAVSLEDVYDDADAIIQMWYPGEQGGNALADILFGDVSPSGKLPVTYPKNVNQLPDFNDYSMKGRTYRYMEQEPLFTFGFGLSYTQTEVGAIQLKSNKIKTGQALMFSVEVSNTGSINGEEVIQAYIIQKAGLENQPLSSLKGFQRVPLNVGETKTVDFEIEANQLKLVNEAGEYVFEKGKYELVVGTASPGKRSEDLGAKFSTIEFSLK